jgi:KipI family sensor histidine kinase inhibitor
MARHIGQRAEVRQRLRIKPKAIVPLGDSAVLVEFGTTVDLKVNGFIQRLAVSIRASDAPWIRDVVPAFASLAIHLHLPALARRDAIALVTALVDTCMRDQTPKTADAVRELTVPVCYDQAVGLDLAEVAERIRLSPAEIAERHAASPLRVLMIGFAPGHPYLGGLDPKLSVPRRATPRSRVPTGSIAIANQQCVVYPYEISGGWNVIGRTPLRVFDAAREQPSLFLPGDAVRFVAIDRAAFDELARREGTA